MIRAGCIVLASLFFAIAKPQSVGVVLSGGGATGLAHVGVLQALEENGIPVDYIAGSSMGALVGGMYAAGISPVQMDSLFHSRLYQTMARGGLEVQDEYYFKQDPPDASLLQLKFDPDTSIQTALPTNLRSPALIDKELMRLFAPASALANGDMDSLFVPFRCVASNITDRHPVIFREGSLAQAVRASMSYPFYFKPILIDGKMMMDGGLYNNFPSDIMYDDFLPDIIIGSNVAYNSAPPDQDDLLSQLRAMLQERTDYTVICENGIIIEPQTDQGLFEFSNPGQAIQDGYNAAMERMPEILAAIKAQRTPQETQLKRRHFLAGQPEIRFHKINIHGLNKAQTRFAKRILNKHDKVITDEELKHNYFRLLADRNIALMFPTARYHRPTGNFELDLDVKKEKELQVRVGGIFSSRPITAGMASVQYNVFGKSSSVLAANTYFGKFYSSAQFRTRTDLSSPAIYIEPVFTMNRWDFFRNFSSFFNEEQPSFIVMRELWGGVNMGTGLGNKGLIKYDVKYAQFKDNYYQTPEFTNQDTSDVTEFFHVTAGISGERNSLNRKQHASRGEQLKASIRYYNGEERTQLGSTAIDRGLQTEFHDWFEARVILEKYFLPRRTVNFGMLLEGVYSTVPFFNNYQVSVMRAPSYAPTPEMKGYFLENFRAQQFAAGGIITMLTFAKNFDMRFEGHVFQPYRALFSDEQGAATEGAAVSNRSYLASGSAIYHSPVGPIWFNTSYIQGLREPWAFSLNFGYMIFNQRVGE